MSSKEIQTNEQREYDIDFLTRLNQYFMDYVAMKERDKREECRVEVEQGTMDKADIEKEVEKEIDWLVNLPTEGRIKIMVNNFRANFPGGIYRNYLANENIADSMDKEDLAFNRQLFSDLDASIAELGLGEKAGAIANMPENTSDPNLLKAEAEVYFKMRDKGYDPSKLLVYIIGVAKDGCDNW